jgi:hypothetical protein
LISKLPVFHKARMLNQSVGKGGFSVVDVSDNTEISDLPHAVFSFLFFFFTPPSALSG